MSKIIRNFTQSISSKIEHYENSKNKIYSNLGNNGI